jgi:hypothetical protein
VIIKREERYILLVWRLTTQHTALIWQDGYENDVCDKCSAGHNDHWISITCPFHGYRLLDLDEDGQMPFFHRKNQTFKLRIDNSHVVGSFQDFERWIRNCSKEAADEPFDEYPPEVEPWLNIDDARVNSLYKVLLGATFYPIGNLLFCINGNNGELALHVARNGGQFKIVPIWIRSQNKKSISQPYIIGTDFFMIHGEFFRLLNTLDIPKLRDASTPSTAALSISPIPKLSALTVVSWFSDHDTSDTFAIVVTYDSLVDCYKLWLVTPLGQRQLTGPIVGTNDDLPIKQLRIEYSDQRNTVYLLCDRKKKIIRLINGYRCLIADTKPGKGKREPDYYTYDIDNPLFGTRMPYHRSVPVCRGIATQLGNDYLLHSVQYINNSGSVDSLIAREVCNSINILHRWLTNLLGLCCLLLYPRFGSSQI